MPKLRPSGIDPAKLRPSLASGGPAAPRAGGALRLGWLLLGLLVLGGSAAAVYKLYPLGRAEVRKVFFFRSVEATVTEYIPPLDYLDDRDHLRQHPGRIRYAFRLDKRYEGAYEQPKGPRSNDDDLAGRFSRGDRVTAYYDPAAPQQNTLSPAADPRLLTPVLLLLPLVVLGLQFMKAGLGDRKPSPAAGRGCYAHSSLALSVLAAAGFYCIADTLPWQKACILGLGLIVPVVPLASLLAGGLCIDRARKRQAAEEALLQTPEAQAALEFKPAPPALMPRQAGSALAALGAVAWFALVAIVLYVGVVSAKDHLQARGQLETADGVVVASAVQPVTHQVNNRTVTFYTPAIRFIYKVGGREYEANAYAWGMIERENAAQAEQIVNRYVPQTPVKVYYRPAEPHAGVLDPRLPPARLVLLVAVQPPVVIAIAMAVAILLRPLRRRAAMRFLSQPMDTPWRVPSWGRLDEEEDGTFVFRTRPRRFAIAGACYAACAMAVLVAIALGGGASRLTEVTAAYATAASLCAGLLGWLLAGQGKPILEIHLPQGMLAACAQEIPLDQVQSWALSWVRRHRGRGLHALAPQLAIRLSGGGEIPLHVFRSRQPLLDAQVARKTAEEFARLTGGIVIGHRPPAQASPV